MIWNKSQASGTLSRHGENVSADFVDVMRSQLPEPEVADAVSGQSHRRAVVALRAQLVPEVCQKSSINESYYNLDKVLS